MHAISVGSLLLAPLIETHHRIDDFQVLSMQLQSCPDPANVRRQIQVRERNRLGQIRRVLGRNRGRSTRRARLQARKATLRQSAAGCLDHTAVPTKQRFAELDGEGKDPGSSVERVITKTSFWEWKTGDRAQKLAHERRPFCSVSHVVARELL